MYPEQVQALACLRDLASHEVLVCRKVNGNAEEVALQVALGPPENPA